MYITKDDEEFEVDQIYTGITVI